ncbi:hypothetical protein EDD85DRAFT_445970 [Armillaria nabsnona]|nr:hypothetical protein EDD85DRAFT_445970 [Armillaria nabsnona]
MSVWHRLIRSASLTGFLCSYVDAGKGVAVTSHTRRRRATSQYHFNFLTVTLAMLVLSPTPSDDLFPPARIHTFRTTSTALRLSRTLRNKLHIKAVFYMLYAFLASYALAWTYQYNSMRPVFLLLRRWSISANSQYQ